MVLMPCSKCCKTWRCLPMALIMLCWSGETPPAGWTTDGISHAQNLIASPTVALFSIATQQSNSSTAVFFAGTDPDQIWQPYSTVIYNDKDSCDINCGRVAFVVCLTELASLQTVLIVITKAVFSLKITSRQTPIPPPVVLTLIVKTLPH